jgi:glucosamine 6-phosphate synthetase-like amidotransferase/phosphosugar isomerase protein
MCGLFGFITQNGSGPNLTRLRRIAIETEQRGRHAFGLAWLDREGAIHTFKRPGPATDCLDDLDLCRDAAIVIGHCRYATHGNPADNRNNHPHPAGRGWIVHNGVVRNHAALTTAYHLAPRSECDSEILGLLLSRCPGPLDVRAAHTVALADGPLAMLGIWTNPARLLIVRRGNPLHFGETQRGFYFGSLPGQLSREPRPVADYMASTLTLHQGALVLQRRPFEQGGAPLSCL